jgi:hypothetical protein
VNQHVIFESRWASGGLCCFGLKSRGGNYRFSSQNIVPVAFIDCDGRRTASDLVLLFMTSRHNASQGREAVASVVGPEVHIVGGGASMTGTAPFMAYHTK